MRTVLIFAAIALAGAPAAANPLSKLDPAAIPPQCRGIAGAPTPTEPLLLQARISTATCMVGVALDGVQRTIKNPSAGVGPLGDAASPAINLLDEVIAHGDPETTIVAQHAKGDIYVGLAVRLRNTVPGDNDTTPTTVLLQHDAMRATIEPAAKAWLDAAARAFQCAIAESEEHSELRPNRVIARALEMSSEALADTHTVVGVR